MQLNNSSLNKDEIAALRKWFSTVHWSYYIVLSPNKYTRNGTVRTGSDFLAHRMADIKLWHAKSDRALLGKRWAKSTNRTVFVGFPEIGPKSGLLHFNLLVQPPTLNRDAKTLTAVYEKQWEKLYKNSSELLRERFCTNEFSRTDARSAIAKLDKSDLVKNFRPEWYGDIEIRPYVPGTMDNLLSYNSKFLWTRLGSEGWFFSMEHNNRKLRCG